MLDNGQSRRTGNPHNERNANSQAPFAEDSWAPSAEEEQRRREAARNRLNQRRAAQGTQGGSHASRRRAQPAQRPQTQSPRTRRAASHTARSATNGNAHNNAPSHSSSFYRDPPDSSHNKLHAYRPEAYQGRRARRSRVPIVAVCVVVVCAIVIGAGFAVANTIGKAASDSSGSTEETSQLSSDQDAAAAPAEDPDVVMTLGGDQQTYVLAGEEYLEAGCHAVDPDEGDITSTVEIAGAVDTSTPGDYTITYTATTSAGAIATAEREVHVVESFEEEAASLPVLMYHYVYTESAAPDSVNGNYLLDTKLEAQLQYLSENDYYYPSYEEIKAFVEGTHTLPAKSVVLTFDDGEQGFLNYGIPLLEKYQVPATSFIICSDADATDKILTYASSYVSFQSHTYEMHQAGSVNVGHGGRIHSMTQQEIYDDLVQAQGILGTTEALAYPYGDYNESAQAAVSEAGILCAFTTDNARIYPGDDPTKLSRVRISGEYTQDGFEYLVTPNGE